MEIQIIGQSFKKKDTDKKRFKKLRKKIERIVTQKNQGSSYS